MTHRPQLVGSGAGAVIGSAGGRTAGQAPVVGVDRASAVGPSPQSRTATGGAGSRRHEVARSPSTAEIELRRSRT